MAASSSTSRAKASGSKIKAGEEDVTVTDETTSTTTDASPVDIATDIAPEVVIPVEPTPVNNSNPDVDVPVLVADVPTDQDVQVKLDEIARVRAECEAMRQQIQVNAQLANRVSTVNKLDAELAQLTAQRNELQVAVESSAQAALPILGLSGPLRDALTLAVEAQIAQERAVDAAQAEAPDGVTVEFPHPSEDPTRQVLVTHDLVTAAGRLRSSVKAALGIEGTK